MAEVDRVAGARGIPGEARVLGGELVVAPVVDALERQRRPEVVALRRVVVDHVEDDLDPGVVQRPDRGLEARHAGLAQETGLRGEEGEGGVAPVVAQALLDEEAVVGEGLDRHQLHGGDAELHEVLDDARVAQAGVGAPQHGGQVAPQLGKALHVGLVDHGVDPGDARLAIVAPAVGRVLHHAFRHHGGAVAPVEGEVAPLGAETVAEQGVVPADAAEELPRVRVDEELVRVEAVALAGLVGTVHPVAVEGPGAQALDVTVPDLVRAAGEADALGFPAPVRVEQAEVDGGGVGREEREVHPLAIPGRAQRQGLAIIDAVH